jgi:hypothetical protein
MIQPGGFNSRKRQKRPCHLRLIAFWEARSPMIPGLDRNAALIKRLRPPKHAETDADEKFAWLIF